MTHLSPNSRWAERVEDFERHLVDLESSRYEGTDTRADRETVFRRAVDLLQPVVVDVMAAFNAQYLDGAGETDFSLTDADGLVAQWSIGWPAQRAARRRAKLDGPEAVGPITIRAIFPPGWTHGHVGGEHIGFWPLQVTSAADADRQADTLWAIAEAELHEWIYQSSEPWTHITPRKDAATGPGARLVRALAKDAPAYGLFARNSISGELLDLAAQLGLDLIVLDFEHGPQLPDRELALLAEIAHLRGIALLARLAAPDPHLAAHVIDRGVCGVVIPNCESWAQARAIVDACYLPPTGGRGYSPTSNRARLVVGSSGLSSQAAAARINSETVVILQIESPSLASELPEIVGDERIAALLFGFHDLEVRDERPPSHWRALAQAATRDKPVAWGQVTAPSEVDAALDDGARLLMLGSDTSLIRTSLAESVKSIKRPESEV